MKKEIYLYSGIVSLAACVISAFFNWRIATGILIGALSSLLYFYILNLNFKIVDGNISKGGALGFFVRILILALPLLIACLLPDYFNIFGAFGGVMIFRIIMMVMFFKEKEGV